MIQQNGYHSSYGGGSSYSSCSHDSTKPVFESRGIEWYGGKYTEAGQYVDGKPKFDLVLALAGKTASPLVQGVRLSDQLQEFASSFQFPTLFVDWPDYKATQLTREQWLDLIDRIVESGYKSVYVCCMGGHGRTGTALTLIGELTDALDKSLDPVGVIRTTYCKKAVESYAQMDYIEHILGFSLNVKPAKSFGSSKSYTPPGGSSKSSGSTKGSSGTKKKSGGDSTPAKAEDKTPVAGWPVEEGRSVDDDYARFVKVMDSGQELERLVPWDMISGEYWQELNDQGYVWVDYHDLPAASS